MLSSHSLICSCQRMRSVHSLTLHTKVNGKGIKDLDIRVETIRLLEDNIIYVKECSAHNNIFLDLSRKAREIKAKRNKLVVIKVKTFAQQRKPSTK